MIDVRIVGNNGNTTAVAPTGELITGPLDFDTPMFQNMDIADQAYNFFPPKIGKQFVVRAIIMTANKNVTTDCTVDIYESSAEDSTIIVKSILQLEMLKNTVFSSTPLNILITEGLWLNGKTDDDDVFATLTGYYIPRIG